MDTEYHCLNCSHVCDDDEIIMSSLDAFAGPDDFDLFCPECESDNIVANI